MPGRDGTGPNGGDGPRGRGWGPCFVNRTDNNSEDELSRAACRRPLGRRQRDDFGRGFRGSSRGFGTGFGRKKSAE